jgi:DNA-binding NarL/FixJ family response regulator
MLTIDRLAAHLAAAYSEITAYQHLITMVQVRPVPPPSSISPRELLILTLLADGYTKAEAAAELELSQETIKTHMSRLRSRWGARSTAQLVAIAKDAWLIPARTQ